LSREVDRCKPVAAGATLLAAAFLLLVPLSDRAASFGMAGDSLDRVDSFSGKSG